MTSSVEIIVRLGPGAIQNLSALSYVLELSFSEVLEMSIARAIKDLNEPVSPSKMEGGRSDV